FFAIRIHCLPFKFFFFSSRRRHTRFSRDWSSDVCSSDLNDLVMPWLVRLAFLGVGVLVGLYVLAPRQVRASDTYLPPAYAAIPNAVFAIDTGDGLVTLPAKIADTVALRNVGFKDVGAKAIETELLL